ncbi:MAG: hypothetical protein Kow0075_04690 [Salibacteraceae bacterium]
MMQLSNFHCANCAMFLFMLMVGLSSGAAFGQYTKVEQWQIEEAESYFDLGDYVMVWSLLEPLVVIHQNDPYLQYMMGVAAFEIPFRKHLALTYLEKSAKSGYAGAYYHYARALLHAERADEAYNWLERLPAGCAVQEGDVALLRSYCQNAVKYMEAPVGVVVENLGPNVNTDYTEHTPLVSMNDSVLYFTSRRPISTDAEKDLNGNYDENIYVSYRNGHAWGKSKPIPGNVNGPLNESVVSLSINMDQMLIFKTSRDMVTSDLWLASMKQGNWELDEKLGEPVNSKYIENSAAISSQGDVYFVASDRPGGYGGMDLYRIVKFANGEFSKPQNLGPEINTPYDELSPFLLPNDRVLYFSSNRPESMGGFDVFKTEKLTDGSWSSPKNLGYPLNTTRDDLHLSVSWKSGRAYMTRERPDMPGNFDIYTCNLPGFNIAANVFFGRLPDAAHSAETSITLRGIEGRVIGQYSANEQGEFVVVLSPGDSGVLEVLAPGYQPYHTRLDYTPSDGVREVQLNLVLTPIAE